VNREIKFRAWDTEKVKMLYPDGIYGQEMGANTYSITCLIAGVMNGACDEFQEQYILMQFTGRKDKNGKELYEGDIFRARHDFGPGGFSERISSIPTKHNMNIQWQYWNMETIEVIGNIYENPELLP
jgi:uncharacterized phage protein (TIGR01671 family)